MTSGHGLSIYGISWCGTWPWLYFLKQYFSQKLNITHIGQDKSEIFFVPTWEHCSTILVLAKIDIQRKLNTKHIPCHDVRPFETFMTGVSLWISCVTMNGSTSSRITLTLPSTADSVLNGPKSVASKMNFCPSPSMTLMSHCCLFGTDSFYYRVLDTQFFNIES